MDLRTSGDSTSETTISFSKILPALSLEMILIFSPGPTSGNSNSHLPSESVEVSLVSPFGKIILNVAFPSLSL